jgi:hypothetical protein
LAALLPSTAHREERQTGRKGGRVDKKGSSFFLELFLIKRITARKITHCGQAKKFK